MSKTYKSYLLAVLC
ncbi:TPA: DUF1270 family protein, partial [Staphylococcus aureus]|nr:DUF1270 family protein [Staphylococcus aureus]HDF1602978.1 DUF1270 family protein [Staphylococcus aureus]HDF8180636.1 DUF1270 family protein [Staphylococcus aureus]HDG4495954.1 DUF1270 family protein [Staphylococcus aureus]